MSRPAPGEIALVDWRGGARPNEPTKIRAAIVVSSPHLFAEGDNLLVVPLTRDQGLAHAHFALRIEPTLENGAAAVCWALSHHLTSVSTQRVRTTPSRVTSEQLRQIRQRLALALGMDE